MFPTANSQKKKERSPENATETLKVMVQKTNSSYCSCLSQMLLHRVFTFVCGRSFLTPAPPFPSKLLVRVGQTGQSEWTTGRTLYGSILGSHNSRYGKATFDSKRMEWWSQVEQIISRGMMMWCLESQLEPQDTRVSSRCCSLHTWRWVNSVCHQDGAVLASRLIRLEEKITSWRRFTLEVPSAHWVYNNTPLK